MKKDDIKKHVQEGKDKWLIWIGYILDENDEKREIEYFGKFAPTKKSVIGLVKSMIDNTSPYRIIIQELEPFKIDPTSMQTELTDFFRYDEK